MSAEKENPFAYNIYSALKDVRETDNNRVIGKYLAIIEDWAVRIDYALTEELRADVLGALEQLSRNASASVRRRAVALAFSIAANATEINSVIYALAEPYTKRKTNASSLLYGVLSNIRNNRCSGDVTQDVASVLLAAATSTEEAKAVIDGIPSVTGAVLSKVLGMVPAGSDKQRAILEAAMDEGYNGTDVYVAANTTDRPELLRFLVATMTEYDYEQRGEWLALAYTRMASRGMLSIKELMGGVCCEGRWNLVVNTALSKLDDVAQAYITTVDVSDDVSDLAELTSDEVKWLVSKDTSVGYGASMLLVTLPSRFGYTEAHIRVAAAAVHAMVAGEMPIMVSYRNLNAMARLAGNHARAVLSSITDEVIRRNISDACAEEPFYHVSDLPGIEHGRDKLKEMAFTHGIPVNHHHLPELIFSDTECAEMDAYYERFGIRPNPLYQTPVYFKHWLNAGAPNIDYSQYWAWSTEHNDVKIAVMSGGTVTVPFKVLKEWYGMATGLLRPDAGLQAAIQKYMKNKRSYYARYCI